MTRPSLAVTILAVVALVIGLGPPPSWSATDKPLPIRIGWQPSGEFRFFVAKELKLFEKAGLQPTYVKFNAGPPTLAALKAGDIDVTFLGSVPALAALAQGIDVKIIMPANEGLLLSALVARSDSGIKTLADIKGKKIATTKGASVYMGLLKALDLQKLTLKDIEFVDLAVPNMVPAFVSKSVDAIWVWSPWSSKLEAENGRVVAGMKDVGITWAQQLWLVRTDWLAREPEAARRLIHAFDLASQALKSDPTPAVTAVADTLAIPVPMAKAILAADYYPSLDDMVNPAYASAVVGAPDKGYAKGLREQAGFMRMNGFIKTLPDVTKAIDPNPVLGYLKTRR